MKITIASIHLGEGGGGRGDGGEGMEEVMKEIFLQNEAPDCKQVQFHFSRIGK